MCTTFVVTKGASITNSPITSMSNDVLGADDVRLMKVDGWKNWDEYEIKFGRFQYSRMRPIYLITKIIYPRAVDT